MIEINQFKLNKRKQAKRRLIRTSFLSVLISILLTSYGYLAYQRPLPEAKTDVVTPTPKTISKPDFKWPSFGQAAFGAQNFGLLDSTPSQVALPTASVIKVLTALAVLKKMPLTKGQTGPLITLGDQDYSDYLYFSGNDGSVVPIEVGEQITEYQALQAMLLASANNFANSLARWAYGSLEAYVSEANSLVQVMGMSATHVDDSSGFSAKTVSTSSDLVKLGLAAMNNPVIAEIVSQTEANVPVAGLIKNTNIFLGQNNVIGIKTGSTDAAGGCYLLATQHQYPNAQKLVVVGAIMGAPTLKQAMLSGATLLNSVYSGFADTTVAHSGDTLGKYKFPWGEAKLATATASLEHFRWYKQSLKPTIQLDPITIQTSNNSTVGRLIVSTDKGTRSVDLKIAGTVKPPNLWWRLTHY